MLVVVGLTVVDGPQAAEVQASHEAMPKVEGIG
jgi:hypothetical protein